MNNLMSAIISKKMAEQREASLQKSKIKMLLASLNSEFF